MTTKAKHVTIAGIPVEVVHKDIKNLHVGVYPPRGHVRVAAPLRLDDEAVNLAVLTRLGWIRKQQRQFQDQQRQSQREMLTGESHFYQGRRYRLDVIERPAPPRVHVIGKSTLRLQVRPGTTADRREAILQAWYRARLREQLPGLLRKWEPKVGVDVSEVRIKKMKTLWGSCNADARRIWLNVELAKHLPVYTEYILVHEMVHLLERHHNDRFRELMDGLIPNWRQHRDGLNRGPLGHEEWRY